MKAFQTLTVSTAVLGFNPEIFMAGFERSNSALVDVQTAGIRFRTDGGNPSASVGMVANAGDIIELKSYNEVQLFKVIRSGAADATLNVDFS